FRVLLHLPLLLFMGNIQRCPFVDPPDPSLSCIVRSVSLDPDSCVELENPCADQQWAQRDSFFLVDEPAGLSMRTVGGQVSGDPRRRFVCAGVATPTLIDVPVEFEYVRAPDIGVGTIRVTVGANPLIVAASATPNVIQPGEASQLDATATGGIPPYMYFWSPSAGLNATDIANPVASPNVSTQYTVFVTDSSGAQAGAAVIVNVGVAVNASATPSTISPGESSNLSVQVQGGTPPYSFSWTPADSLSAPNIGVPTATPTATTTYTVTVTDFLGAVATAQVTVTVTTGLSACMTLTSFSELAAQADGSCSTGAIVEYRWWAEFFGTGQPPTAVTTDPLSPIFRYEGPGPHLIRLEVVDASGATSATTAVHDPP
ncbi:MAG: PKD domain-containing protein, partial [bacterium]